MNAFGHELANDGIDVAIDLEAQAQRAADVKCTRPRADDLPDAWIELVTNTRPHRGAGRALESAQHLLRRDGQAGKVHRQATLEIGRSDARRMHEIGGHDVWRANPET